MRNNPGLILAASALALLLCACGGGSTFNEPAGAEPGPAARQTDPAPQANSALSTWPAALPAGAAQPWERLNDAGFVAPGGERHASTSSQSAGLLPGADWFLAGGDAAANGRACALASQDSAVSYAVYRIPLGGAEPGLISVDVNVTAGTGYYIGLADYGRDAWVWHGPYSTNNTRLPTAGATAGHYTSSLGLMFACVVVHDGSAADVVALEVFAADPADDVPPPQPGAPQVTPVAGGLLLEWLPVAAGDLAGYRVYSANGTFNDGYSPGVSASESLAGKPVHLLTDLEKDTWVRVSAFDVSGNESAPGEIVHALPLPLNSLDLKLAVSSPSGLIDDQLLATASGAALHDFDLDGDGIYEVTDSESGEAVIDTSRLGITRVGVRGRFGFGDWFGLAGASVLIGDNLPPVARADATFSTGDAPLHSVLIGATSSDPDGFIIGGGWDFEGDGIYDVWSDADTSLVEATQHTFLTGSYMTRLMVVDNLGARGIDELTITVLNLNNIAPTAHLEHEVEQLDRAISAEFNALSSYDLDGVIVNYEWDFDGDGLFSEPGAEAGLAGQPQTGVVIFPAGPEIIVSVRVTDNDAAQTVTGVAVAPHGWVSYPAAQDLGRGENPSLAIIGGKPAIAFSEGGTNGKIHYMRALDEGGTAWADPVQVDPVDGRGTHRTLLEVNGHPAVAYYRIGAGYYNLWYVRALDPEGENWPAPQLIDADSNSGGLAVLAIIDGMPAIAHQYYHSPGAELRYVRALDANGDTWGATVIVDDEQKAGYWPSLAEVAGRPAISYIELDQDDLKYVRALDAAGTSWGTPTTIGNYRASYNTNLVVAGGNPAICYYDDHNQDLLYVRALDSAGQAWGDSIILDSEGMTGSYASMALVDGLPAVAFRRFVPVGDWDSRYKILYLQALEPSGASWGQPFVIGDNPGLERPSLIDQGSHAAVAYRVPYNPTSVYYGKLY